jgi:hypothetical protein
MFLPLLVAGQGAGKQCLHAMKEAVNPTPLLVGLPWGGVRLLALARDVAFYSHLRNDGGGGAFSSCINRYQL